MKLTCESLANYNTRTLFLEEDENGREVYHYLLKDGKLIGDSLVYPNPKIFLVKEERLINPIEETTMSLKNLKSKSEFECPSSFSQVFELPVFYFIYNTDNYFHFLYDSLPYLHSYLHLKKTIKNLKLLMSYPHENATTNYKFVNEALDLLGIQRSDIEIVNPKTLYREIYISSSYTHGKCSNLPPRKEVYSFFKNINVFNKNAKETPKKIYISRRSWKHGNYENIGTNYTLRRKLKNEDQLVEELSNRDFVEIFTETLTLSESIRHFQNAEIIVGAIGGGLANSLFCRRNTKLVAIISPTFLDINSRFAYAFGDVQTLYVMNTSHVETGKFKRYMRVKTLDNKVGEISEVNEESCVVNFSRNEVAGWNASASYSSETFSYDDIMPLDQGLNSEWIVDINDVISKVELE
jgi:hypothetical protein